MRPATSPALVAATRSPGRSRSTCSISQRARPVGAGLARSRSASRDQGRPEPQRRARRHPRRHHRRRHRGNGENTSSADDASRTATSTQEYLPEEPARTVADVPVAGSRGRTPGNAASVSTGIDPQGRHRPRAVSSTAGSHPSEYGRCAQTPLFATSYGQVVSLLKKNNAPQSLCSVRTPSPRVHGYRLEIVEQGLAARSDAVPRLLPDLVLI